MFCIYKTDPDWITVCKSLPPDTQVNFWRKNTNNLNLPTGSWIYFSERGTRKIVGRGILIGYDVHTIGQAWQLYGIGNGVQSLGELKERAVRVLEVDSMTAQIGCVLLSELDFLPLGQEYIVSEQAYHPNIVGPKFFQDEELPELQARFNSSKEIEDGKLKEAPAKYLIEGGDFFSYRHGYERNPEARRKCLGHHGYRCRVCDVLMEDTYGVAARDLIHVHHLFPISESGGQHLIDPVKELAPLCPNCHAVAHRRVPPFSIEELKKFLTGQKSSKIPIA